MREVGGPVVSARAATYAVLLVSLLIALMVVFAAVIFATRTQIAASQDAASRRNVERVLGTLQGELDSLDIRAQDWAQWDDTYAFVDDPNPTYVQSNLTPEAIRSVGADVLIILNAKDELVWGKASSELAAQAGTDSAELVDALSSSLVQRTGDAPGTTGVVRLAGVPVIFSALPITTTDGKGPSRGLLVMGQALSPSNVSRLSTLANVKFSLIAPNDSSLPAGLLTGVASADQGSASGLGRLLERPGYGVVLGMDGLPLLVISAIEPPEDLAGASRGLAILMGVLLIVGIGWGGATLTFVERTSLSRMSWLRESVANVATGEQEFRRIDLRSSPVNDDVWVVASEINAMLDTLDESRRAYDAIQEFFAKASHELRTPLNSVIGFSSLLSRGMAGPLNDEQQRQVDMILSSGSHLLALTNDLLDVEKLHADRIPLDFGECDINALVQECVEIVRPMAVEKHLELRLELGSVGTTSADYRRVRQAVLNLLGNAIKFTDTGEVSVRTATTDRWIEIHVSDTGRGIAPSLLPKVFDEFFATVESNMPSGTGLGLAITRHIAIRHGGEVTVTSTEGAGSSFVFRLPLERASEEPEVRAADPT